MKEKYPSLNVDYYTSDTGKELDEANSQCWRRRDLGFGVSYKTQRTYFRDFMESYQHLVVLIE